MASAVMTSVQAAKKAMRRDFTKRLRTVPEDVISAESIAVAARVIASTWYKHSKNISVYLSTPSAEIQTDPIINDAFNQGKRVFVPFCPVAEPTVMRMLRLRSLDDFNKLGTNRWGVREVNPREAEGLEDAEDPAIGGLDLIIVPGLGFDRTGQRLGHGRGYYDRYIRSMESYPSRFNKPPSHTMALALTAQVLEEGVDVPVEDWDRKPNVIFTKDGPIIAESPLYQ